MSDPVDVDDDEIPISALQHVTYCRRRAALVHVERQWADNRYTAEGVILHGSVDRRGRAHERRHGRSVARRLPIWSRRLGLTGIADLVEFDRAPGQGAMSTPSAIRPVEYKRRVRYAEAAYHVQLCAQAICLEEMFAVEVPVGILYAGLARTRIEVRCDAPLRARVRQAIDEVRALRASGRTPAVQPGARCRPCSLRELCRPELLRPHVSATGYLLRVLRTHAEEEPEG